MPSDTSAAPADLPAVLLSVPGLKALPGPVAPGYYAWPAVRARFADSGLPPGTPVHHWLIPQGTWGKFVPAWIKNRELNLMVPPAGYQNALDGRLWHQGLHGQGNYALGLVGRLWHGSPLWAKVAAGGVPSERASARMRRSTSNAGAIPFSDHYDFERCRGRA